DYYCLLYYSGVWVF
nr:immunoglobulin light chain junction region [Macaca mulatta]